ncbi:hypothetical protein M0804_010950 [Polistes exclamans]|nr:hypothetical protein M0804_010950 [Polistes exclamans]
MLSEQDLRTIYLFDKFIGPDLAVLVGNLWVVIQGLCQEVQEDHPLTNIPGNRLFIQFIQFLEPQLGEMEQYEFVILCTTPFCKAGIAQSSILTVE